jgi:serine/threonine-protein kinase
VGAILRSKRARWALALVALFSLGASLAWHRMYPPALPAETASAATGVHSIAILPFHRIDASTSEDEYLGVGLTDALITSLGNVQSLVVRPTIAVLRYNKPDQDPLAAGREQEVDALLEGTIQKAGPRLRLSVRLLRVRDGASLWAAKYDEDFSDVFKLQDSIAEQTTRALLPRLTGEQGERLARRHTQNVAAYDLYLQGRYHFNRMGPENMRKAIAYFDRALALDPSFALAYADAAMAYSVLIAIGAETYEAGSAKATAAADKAIALDESLAEAHGAQAAIRLIAWDIDGVEREVRRVIELNPSIPEAYSMLGYVYQLRGRLPDAVAITRKSVEINPLSPLGRADLSEASYYARDWNAAIAEYERLVAIEPAIVPPFFILGQALERRGDRAGAIAQCEAAIKRSGRVSAVISALGYAHASAGHRTEALALARELETQWRKEPVNPTATLLAILYAGIGDGDRAFEWVDKAYEAHDVQVLFLSVEPQFDNLRGDPRFAAFTRRLGPRRE